MTKCPKTKRSCWFSVLILIFVGAYIYLYHNTQESLKNDRILTLTTWRLGKSAYWVSAAHIVRHCSEDISIADDTLKVVKLSTKYDLALLKGTKSDEGLNISSANYVLLKDKGATIEGHSDLGFTVLDLMSTGKKVISQNKSSAYLEELDEWKVLSISPRRKSLVGISGSPVVLNDTNEVIGVLVQAGNNKKIALSIGTAILSKAFDMDFKTEPYKASIADIKKSSIQRLQCKKQGD